MKINFKIVDDIYLSSEYCELTIHDNLFDKPRKTDKNLIGLCKYIACLRGHKMRDIEIIINDVID